MQDASPPTAEVEPPADEPITARGDLTDAACWIALGIAILVGSITMDRLEQQHINPYTVPGLLPGLLGIMMIVLGGILALRSMRRGALHLAPPPPSAHDRERWRRIWVVTALCLGYGVVLIGHGLPFWLASTIYVTGSILIIQRMSRDPAERRRTQTPKAWAKALTIGLSSSVITHLVFQEFFLVRLP
ncbi:MAG: tripartite tricarboxylate transporter TctB family protein [Betaproteobacteria bacterium]|nr:tripartite tricarboxylate transporter TctB family protein [Betaproteobacteria bacterium]MBK7082935.1 tripartite tricarboxylate transporter TctB family protein [Betaproteobacteria bacterium]MBK9674197.1 tripartite tricarboxylate transporter TctB family protein [Betaproteobacteria bacterium]MBL0291607.1 tripartite tricarboxylate transporter TctB family protein [Betaproteobacteria bacterium]